MNTVCSFPTIDDIDAPEPDRHYLVMKMLPNVIALTLTLTMLACSDGRADSSRTSNSMAAQSAAPKPSVRLDGRVTDAAHILSTDFRAKLSAKLERFENKTHHQLVVVTVSSLGGRDVANYTRDLSNAWGVGRKGYNDGIVLLVAPNERKARIAVGYGLETVLTEPVCRQIIDATMLPRFRHGDFTAGIEGGSDALMARLI